MLVLIWFSSACNEQDGQAGSLYVNTTISMDGNPFVWLMSRTGVSMLPSCDTAQPGSKEII